MSEEELKAHKALFEDARAENVHKLLKEAYDMMLEDHDAELMQHEEIGVSPV
jgi:hypothetical protein